MSVDLFGYLDNIDGGPLPVRIKRLNQFAKIPRIQSLGATCFDLHSTEGGTIQPRRAMSFGTGLAFAIPEGYAMYVYSRSGHGFNHDVRLANAVGVIDSDYRGEVKVKLTNDACDTGDPFDVRPGDRIAQAQILPVPKVRFIEVDELDITVRGLGGFGSSGR